MKKHKKSIILWCLTIAFAVLLSGCSDDHSISSDIKMKINFDQNGQIAMCHDSFNGIERGSLEIRNGQRIYFDYDTNLQKGSLVVKWQDPSGAAIWQKILSESENGTEEIVSASPGRYSILIQGQDATGSFNATWEGR